MHCFPIGILCYYTLFRKLSEQGGLELVDKYSAKLLEVLKNSNSKGDGKQKDIVEQVAVTSVEAVCETAYSFE